jgi:hypothetical protein
MAEASLVAAERLDGGRRKTTHLTTAKGPEMTAADSPVTLLSPEGGRGVAWLQTRKQQQQFAAEDRKDWLTSRVNQG